jgi:hypothetical protein
MANVASDPWSWNNMGWATSDNSGNTANVNWYRRLRGPRYSVHRAILIVRESPDHKPQTFANIAGVQFKRITRRGTRHYYRAVA